MGTEIRNTISAELRVKDGEGNKLVGYAAVYGKPSAMLFANGRSFVEVVMPGAFARSLASGAEVKADIGHARERVIGRRSKSTLVLSEDANGLLAEITPGSDSDGRDAMEKVRRGDVDQMSFEFRVNKGGEQWSKQADNTWLRTLTDLELLRVTLTAEPAYPDTSIAVRALEQQEQSEQQQERKPDEPKHEGVPLKCYEFLAKIRFCDETPDK